jgi:hypothetical protein
MGGRITLSKKQVREHKKKETLRYAQNLRFAPVKPREVVLPVNKKYES